MVHRNRVQDDQLKRSDHTIYNSTPVRRIISAPLGQPLNLDFTHHLEHVARVARPPTTSTTRSIVLTSLALVRPYN